VGQFDVVICLETIEHVLNDASLMTSMARCLKPGGMLCLTTPNFDYRPITKGDEGPFLTEETGWHVRKGYTEQDLSELCRTANLEVCKVGFISGFLSQKVTWLFRTGNKLHLLVGWLSTLFLRIFPPVIDGALARWTGWPGFSITLVARKP
jgi:SAM-dependent methyltransferase